MSETAHKLRELGERKNGQLALGGAHRVAKQHEAGKLTARERMSLLFDNGVYQEIGMFVAHRCTDFGMDRLALPGDGVVTGYGMVNGRPVCAFAHDFTCLGGSTGEMQSRKICRMIDQGTKTGVPVVGLYDSAGGRIQEGVDALSGSSVFYFNSLASGVIPQISAIMGPGVGGAAYSPALTDWVLMVEKTSHMYVTGPAVIEEITGERVSHDDLGGARVHATKSGVAHFICKSDEDAVAQIKVLLSYLPSSWKEEPPTIDTHDPSTRECPELDTIIPDSPSAAYDMRRVILSIVDEGLILEPHHLYARNIIVCFARLAGRTVGVVANQPMHMAGCLDIDASDKASRFIRFCDAFNIPLITLVDVPGYLPGTQQETSGIIRHGAKILWAYSEATVPKATVIIRKAYGGGYSAMACCHLGVDAVLAWPTAEIAIMGAEGAAKILHSAAVGQAEGTSAILQEKVREYRELLYNPYVAASRGYVDAVIMPRETRSTLISTLEILRRKNREIRPERRHGNIPL